MSVQIRPARVSDDTALAALDRRCWSARSEVAARREPDSAFFGPGQSPDDVVQQVRGLGIDPDMRGQGIGRAVLLAALDLARYEPLEA